VTFHYEVADDTEVFFKGSQQHLLFRARYFLTQRFDMPLTGTSWVFSSIPLIVEKR